MPVKNALQQPESFHVSVVYLTGARYGVRTLCFTVKATVKTLYRWGALP